MKLVYFSFDICFSCVTVLCLLLCFQECDQHTRLTKLKEEEMKRRHEIERKRLPKIQRDEIKAKSQQYRKSLRIEKRVSMDIEREMMKEVTEKAVFSFSSSSSSSSSFFSFFFFFGRCSNTNRKIVTVSYIYD